MRILKTLIHNLTAAQRTELVANFENAEIVELKMIAPELAEFLANTPDDDSKLVEAADQLIVLALNYSAVLLPCGSPKFAWLLAQRWPESVKPLFAHSVRASAEKEIEKFEPIADEPDKFKKVKVVEKVAIFNHIRWF
ncbi:hypothetical protein ACE1CD_15565 [Aerosakkonema sp. BLCC-F183]|uniref:hypothetical protein n=1 Tax=Aerosakkonema sp. BLCC-F183 TaxID=3342834 RepID=UPI0035B8E13F